MTRDTFYFGPVNQEEVQMLIEALELYPVEEGGAQVAREIRVRRVKLVTLLREHLRVMSNKLGEGYDPNFYQEDE